MDLHHCRYFLAVHEAGNITHAAARLGISQPSLSQQILQFEVILGAKLFDRLGRKIRLTSAGEILLPHARRLIQAAEIARQEIAGVDRLQTGRLSIAYIPTLERLVSAAVALFVRAFPKIKIALCEPMGHEITGMILAGKVDVGIAASRFSPPEIVETILYKEPYVLAFQKGHELESQKITRLTAIGDRPFALFSFGGFSRNMTEEYLRKIKFIPNICLESESLENLLGIIVCTDICALLPKYAVVHRADIGYHDLTNPLPSRNVAILAHKRASMSPAAREFIQIMQQEAALHLR